jgi:hypothetical protein
VAAGELDKVGVALLLLFPDPVGAEELELESRTIKFGWAPPGFAMIPRCATERRIVEFVFAPKALATVWRRTGLTIEDVLNNERLGGYY